MAAQNHHVVIVGGGFGGLFAAQHLGDAPVQITLIDRRNFHLFQPLLYQVATGTLSPADIASPLRHVLGKQRNTEVLLAEGRGLDAAKRVVFLHQGEVGYDSLIIASGATHNYFGNDHWADLAPGLKTVEDATRIRRRIYAAFETAERAAPERVGPLLTFVIAGAGPTGVELAGAVAEIARNTLKGEFRHIDPASARILLVEGTDRVLGTFAPALSERTKRSLSKLGVEVHTGCRVVDIEKGKVTLQRGASAQQEVVEAYTVLWAAGVRASRLGKALHEATGAELDRVGRVLVEPDCSVRGHADIFVIGDLANFSHQTGQPLPGVAQTAMQQGRYVASLIRRRVEGDTAPVEPFHYRDLGNMATIGRASAIVEKGSLTMAGFFAWLAWLFIHLINLVEFENRLLVLVQWAWNFFSWNRSARLITGESMPPPPPES